MRRPLTGAAQAPPSTPTALRLLAVAATTSLLVTACSSAAGAAHTSSSPSLSSQASPGKSGRAGPGDGHAAPDLEKLLPRELDGKALSRASTTGAAIFAEFGDTAWATHMTAFLAAAGKMPADLRYAQVWDPSQGLDLDAGVFQVKGVIAASLRQAIAASSLPDTPGLTESTATISGRQVTVLTDPGGGPSLYLYPRGDVVFYAGSSDEPVIEGFIRALR